MRYAMLLLDAEQRHAAARCRLLFFFICCFDAFLLVAYFTLLMLIYHAFTSRLLLFRCSSRLLTATLPCRHVAAARQFADAAAA